jgi:hypothetical protein
LQTTHRYTQAMPTKSKLKLKPVDMGDESLGQRLARRARNADGHRSRLPREPDSFKSWFPTTKRISSASTPT